MDIFISHSDRDQEWVDRFVEMCKSRGIDAHVIAPLEKWQTDLAALRSPVPQYLVIVRPYFPDQMATLRWAEYRSELIEEVNERLERIFADLLVRKNKVKEESRLYPTAFMRDVSISCFNCAAGAVCSGIVPVERMRVLRKRTITLAS